jgi:hypothetical protein
LIPANNATGSVGYTIAVGTSVTCTYSSLTSPSYVGFADYTPATATSSGCGPYPTPCVFQAAQAPRRPKKLTLADLLR